jgi:N-acetylglucosamine-6-sulfatase
MFRIATAPRRMLRSLPLVVLTLGLVGGRAADRGARGSAARPGSVAATDPDIIMILTDDQDVQLGEIDYMPNVQKLLAQQGTSFSNHLVPLSLSCPSRTTILRGQYPHNTGVLTNALPDGGFEKAYAEGLESATMATALHNAGYRTVLLGKYLNGYPDTTSSTYIPPGWDEWYSPSAGNPYAEYNYTLNQNGTPFVYGSTPADYLTDVIHAKAVDFIKRASTNPYQPMFVYFATYAPHSPYTPAPRHASLFPNVKAPRPPSFNEPDVSAKPDYISGRPLLGPVEIAAIDEDYRNRLRALQAVDEAVADIVATLSATGRLANTYIFFTSDNGYHMGEHRLLPGKYTPYETDLHVPLIVRGPGVPAGFVRDEITGNLDLAETFAEIAGIPPLPFSDGRSLKGLISSTSPSAWRQAFLLEEFNQGEVVVTDPEDRVNPASKMGIREPPDPQDAKAEAPIPPIPSYYGFQARDYKYIEYLDKAGIIRETELYMVWDTFETNNLASQASQMLSGALAQYTASLINCKTSGCRTAEFVAPPVLPASFYATNNNLAIDDRAGDKRYAVQVSFKTSQGGGFQGSGRAVTLTSVGVAHGGAFWFFSADNPEMLVKIVDGCAANGQKWLFASAGTNVGFSLTATDFLTGITKTYTNPDLTAAVPIQDTSFEPCGDASSLKTGLLTQATSTVESSGPWAVRTGTVSVKAPCPAGPTTLCIDGAPGDQRFKVEVAFQTSQGGGLSGKGQAIPLAPVGVTHGGAFWFFSQDNPEMLVKVVDGCSFNSKKWFFASAGTNVGLTVTVTDTVTGAQKTYANPDLNPAQPIQDTSAFAACQ